MSIDNSLKQPESITMIGAGLVGSLMAIYLGNRGYKVTVFEQLPDIRKEAISAGRSINLALANRGIRPLQQVGIMDEVEKLLIPMKGRMLHDLEGDLQFQSYGQKAEEEIYSVSRAGLVSLLRDHAEATGNVTFNFKQELTSIDFENNLLHLEDKVSGEKFEHQYQLLLGSDGAGSQVRQSIETATNLDFSSELLEHSYKELTIPASDAGSFQIEKEALHIWPRGQYMLIALPNLDGSFTVTLFMPNEGEPSFASLKDKNSFEDFFKSTFADAYELIPNAAEMFFDNPTGILGTVRSKDWNYNNVLLFGDAAHAIVPFHGQGMNCGFEDCGVLNGLLNKFDDDWAQIMPAFTEARRANANAIADMALENYIEMRDSVRDPKYQLKKAIAFKLEQAFPQQFIPRYSMVMFHHIPYAQAQSRGLIQNSILNQLTENTDSIDEVNFELANQLVQEQLSLIPLELLE